MSVESSLGNLLRPVRAGERHLLENNPKLAARTFFSLTSPDFADGGAMPRRCAGAGVGENVSPALLWSGVPAAAVELALVMQDPDVPLPWPVTHLVVLGLPPDAGGAAEGAFEAGDGGEYQLGRGSFGRMGYQGPRPVAGHGPHRYVFQMFALGKPLTFNAPPALPALADAMAGSVVARARLTGRYERD
jgi:Raf kinase inhibitor-like YbhB/YbcL family protein